MMWIFFSNETPTGTFCFKVFTADSQREAEEFIKTFKPDLAIFDLMMENEDSGFILCYKNEKIVSRCSDRTGYGSISQ